MTPGGSRPREKQSGRSGRKDKLRALVGLSATGIAPFILSPSVQAALGIAASLFGVEPATTVREQISEWIETWRSELGERLGKAGYHPQYLAARSFTQLLVVTVEAVMKEPSPEKRRMYARILARADTPDWAERVSRVHEVLKTLIDVTEGDLRVLKVLMEHFEGVDRVSPPSMEEKEQRERYKVAVEQLVPKLGDLSEMGLNVYLRRLERLGLLMQRPLINTDIDSGEYVPTHIMAELMQLLADRRPQAT